MRLVAFVVLAGMAAAAVMASVHAGTRRRSRRAASEQPGPPTGERRRSSGEAPAGELGTSPRLSAATAAQLDRWVDAGLLAPEQAEAILAFERQAPGPRGATGRPASRVPPVAEALGYVGAALSVAGLVLVVLHYWPGLPDAGRLALAVGASVLLSAAGAAVREGGNQALTRLRWVLWTAATGSTGLAAAVLAGDILASSPTTVVVATAAAVSVDAGLRWRWRARPLQQVAALAGLVVTVAAIVAEVGSEGAVGLAAWAAGAGLVGVGLRRGTPLPWLTEACGAGAVLVGAGIVAGAWQGPGLLLAVASALVLVAVAIAGALAPSLAERRTLGLAGVGGLVAFLPGTLDHFARQAGAATGLAVLAAGSLLVIVGALRRVRLALLVELVGGLAVIGGGALTAVQWPSGAPVLGIAAGCALVVAGTRPHQALLSVLGSLDLLVNVPWAVARFFPGEGRAPLAVLAAGALLVLVSVRLGRARDRLRDDLSRRGPPGVA